MKALVTISRILVGVLFIISGLIKANDALGFSYKLDEYFTVFNMSFLSGTSLFLAMIICIFEVGLGVALLVGYRMVLVSWLMLLMILFPEKKDEIQNTPEKKSDCFSSIFGKPNVKRKIKKIAKKIVANRICLFLN